MAEPREKACVKCAFTEGDEDCKKAFCPCKSCPRCYKPCYLGAMSPWLMFGGEE